MIHTGLVSVTFRQLEPRHIIDLVQQAGLEAIEWGGDVHVPHGEVLRAAHVRQMTVDAGLRLPSYGSYYRVGHEDPKTFDNILQTALELGASLIRVWAGKRGSADADDAYWEQVVTDSRQIASLAEQEGLMIAYEFHRDTLTDTNASARQLLERVDHPAVKIYWQPRSHATVEENLQALETILPWLTHVHVASEHTVKDDNQATERLPLAATVDQWQRYVEIIGASGRDHHAFIEFVLGDTPEQFLEDAQTLKTLVDPYHSHLTTGS